MTLRLDPDRLVEIVTFLRDDPACLFICLLDVTAVDYPEREQRFDVVTHLLSPKYNTPRPPQGRDGRAHARSFARRHFIPAANWFEREVYDLFGVFFSGHPDSAAAVDGLRV